MKLPTSVFDNEASRLFQEIKSMGAGKGSFSVADSEAFIRSIYVNKLKAPSADKSDINIHLRDVQTTHENVVGFSIKSDLGSPPTLLNAGKTTNFTYRVNGITADDISAINAIDTRTKLIDRMNAIKNIGGSLSYLKMDNEVFYENLIMIDSQMPIIISEMLKGYYFGVASDCAGLNKHISDVNPLSRTAEFYTHKVRELLCAVALGMKPATRWDGSDAATGGYIIVKVDGDVLAYHIYNRDAFKRYLMKNTRFETPSSSRHEFGSLYEKDGEVFIKLNLQIRFT